MVCLFAVAKVQDKDIWQSRGGKWAFFCMERIRTNVDLHIVCQHLLSKCGCVSHQLPVVTVVCPFFQTVLHICDIWLVWWIRGSKKLFCYLLLLSSTLLLFKTLSAQFSYSHFFFLSRLGWFGWLLAMVSHFHAAPLSCSVCQMFRYTSTSFADNSTCYEWIVSFPHSWCNSTYPLPLKSWAGTVRVSCAHLPYYKFSSQFSSQVLKTKIFNTCDSVFMLTSTMTPLVLLLSHY